MYPKDGIQKSILAPGNQYANVLDGSVKLYFCTEEEIAKFGKARPECEPVQYKLNSLGYRSDEFTDRKDLNLLVAGCSATFGDGLSLEFTWPQRLAQLIAEHTRRSVGVWNLGIPGLSNDFISRSILSTEGVLKPDFAVVLFTYPARRELWLSETAQVTYAPSAVPPDPGTIEREYFDKLSALSTQADDNHHFYMNYRLVEMSLEHRGIPMLFSVLEEREIFRRLVDMKRYVKFPSTPAEGRDFGSNCRFAIPPTCTRCNLPVTRETGGFHPAKNSAAINAHHWGRKASEDFARKLYDRFRETGTIQMALFQRATKHSLGV